MRAQIKYLAAALAALALNAALIPAAVGALPRAEQVVQITEVKLDRRLRPGRSSELQVEARILPGWHINSNRPDNPAYIATGLKIAAPSEVAVGAVRYPAAEEIQPSFSGGEKLSVFTGALKLTSPLTPGRDFEANGPVPLTVSLEYQACNDSQCLRPVTITASSRLAAGGGADEAINATAGAASDFDEAPAQAFERQGYLLGFALVLLGGLALNLTPCVYPLIGVTLAYFGNQGGGTRHVAALAGLYVLGIALTFSGVGVAVALSGGLFGAALQNPLVLGAIALMLLGLAGSSFGLFSIQPPQWLLQRAAGARPGYLGAVAMGLGMGVVAAPCIGPLVLGLLLVVERSQSPAFGFALFFTLAVGMGLPYVALALAAGSIRRLPRSGEWLAWVEQLFGFVLIGLALYFVDPLFPNRLMTRALPFYAVAVALYLGLVSSAGNSWQAFKLFKRTVAALAVIALIYLAIPRPRGPELSFSPYSPATLASAKSARTPVVIDFFADWCIPCREMERTTFKDPQVLSQAQRFVKLKADLTHQDPHTQALIDQYEIQGVPTTVFIDSDGKLRKRIVGYIGAPEFLDHLRQID